MHHQCPPTKDENAFQPRPFVGTDSINTGIVRSASSLVGSDLTTSDYAELESRWIDRTLALLAGLRRVDSLTGGEIIGRKSGNYSGILIPYFHPGTDHVREYRLAGISPTWNTTGLAI